LIVDVEPKLLSLIQVCVVVKPQIPEIISYVRAFVSYLSPTGRLKVLSCIQHVENGATSMCSAYSRCNRSNFILERRKYCNIGL